MKIYETDRLLLRPYELSDAAFVLECYNSPKFIQFIGDKHIRTIEDAEQYIRERFLPQFKTLGFGNYLILLKATGEKIGSIGVFEREGLAVKDMGYSLLERFEGKGYAFEAATKIKELAFTEFGVSQLSAITTAENVRSQKLIEKLGLRYKKTIRLPNDPDDLWYYESELSL